MPVRDFNQSVLSPKAVVVDAKNRIDASDIDGAITDLVRVIGATALESGIGEDFSPVIAHLMRARRALREKFAV